MATLNCIVYMNKIENENIVTHIYRLNTNNNELWFLQIDKNKNISDERIINADSEIIQNIFKGTYY